MAQFDFFVISKLTLIFASFAVFTAFFILFSVVVPSWLNKMVRLVFKADLVLQTKRFAALLSKYNALFVASGVSYDLLEQFMMRAAALPNLAIFLAAFFTPLVLSFLY